MAAAQLGGGGGGGGGGPQLDPAKAAAAQALESEGVAHDLGVTGDAVGKMTAAYKASRESQGKAMADMMATAERGPGMFQMMQELNDKERAKLQKDLEGCLKPDQVKAAMASLGTYGREWDRFVDVLSGMALDKEKQFKGLSLIAKYVVDVDAARAQAMAAMDREGMRAASQEHKAKLDTAIKDILTADQNAVWTAATAPRGGPGGGGGGGGGGPGGPGAPGAGAPPPPPAPKN
jgi:hypothetical protein